MSGNKLMAIGVATMALLFGILTAYVLLPPSLRSINADLRARSIPELPGLEKLVGHDEGGLFSAWLFVAVEATDQQLDEYSRRLQTDGGEHLKLGDRPDQLKVVTETFDVMKMPHPHPRLYFKQSRNLPWWKIEKATDGDFFEKSLPKSCWYRVILDRRNHIIYIYWCYS